MLDFIPDKIEGIAAVVSVPIADPRNTPCCQWRASNTSGIRRWRRAPKMKASIGTPLGLSNSGDSDPQLVAGAVNRLFGCAALSVEPFFQGAPFQSIISA